MTTSPAPAAKRKVFPPQLSKVQTLFDHLPHSLDSKSVLDADHPGVHQSFFTLGLKYSNGSIQGSNQRCLALLDIIQDFIRGFSTPEGRDFRHDFAEQLKPNLNFLKKCRPFAVAMENAVEYFNTKRHGGANDDLTESQLKADWIEALMDYQEGIRKAKEAIVEKAIEKIKPSGDTVLIYGISEVVQDVILAAASSPPSSPRKFDLIIVTDRPLDNQRLGKGLGILNELEADSDEAIPSITYTSMAGLSNVIRRVTKVFLGAHALLTNGGVLAHVGTSQVALMAAAHNIPVLVCCETYKFCDKSPTDSFFHNEFGTRFGTIQSLAPIVATNPLEVGQEPGDELEEMKALQKEGLLLTPVIKYDVTPPELVTAVITDVDILPCTSVPVVLRVHEHRQHNTAQISTKQTELPRCSTSAELVAQTPTSSETIVALDPPLCRNPSAHPCGNENDTESTESDEEDESDSEEDLKSIEDVCEDQLQGQGAGDSGEPEPNLWRFTRRRHQRNSSARDIVQNMEMYFTPN